MNKLALFAGITLLSITGSVSAASIGSWIGSDRSWNNNGAFLSANELLTNQGHTVDVDRAISGNMHNYDVFLMGEPRSIPNPSEISELSNWISEGGILLLMGDSNYATDYNPLVDRPWKDNLNIISASLGLSLRWGETVDTAGPFQGGNFATEGKFNIVGEPLYTTPGAKVTGGTVLSENYLNFEALGLGTVFGFADRSDHIFFTDTINTPNSILLLNIANGPVSNVPLPPALWLFISGLLPIFLKRKAAISLT
ncbi:MAG: hypothetical protein PHC51_11895 [bacterium]|nr:hypothetical protein [bacterium]